MELWVQVAALYGALLSTVALLLRWQDQKKRETRLAVLPIFRYEKPDGSEARSFKSIRLKLVNLSMPPRTVYASIAKVRCRRRFLPLFWHTVDLGHLNHRGEFPVRVHPHRSIDIIVREKALRVWISQRHPRGQWIIQVIVHDETRRKHKSAKYPIAFDSLYVSGSRF